MIHKECGRPLYSTPMAGLHIAPDFQYSGSCVEVVFKMRSYRFPWLLTRGNSRLSLDREAPLLS